MKIVSAEEAVADIRSGDQVYIQCAAAVPSLLLDALVARAPELHNVGVLHLHAEGPGPHLAPEMASHFRHRALFIGPNARPAINEGRAEYIPVFLSDVPHLFSSGLIPLDAVLFNVSPPDAHGFCSLGISVESMQAAIRAASLVIAQVNHAMPRTLGESFIHVDDIDYGVEVDIPPYVYPDPEVGDMERRIGEYVADLVPDGATLQMGIGAIPFAAAKFLGDKKDLGIHTELMTNSIMELAQAGVITGMAKERNRGKIVCTFMMGTPELYRFADDNPMVEMRPCDFTNDTHIIRSFRRMTSVNSAIAIDLTGQVCADSIGWHLYSGVGGQLDFIRGSALAPEGRAIIALPSTAAEGRVSRITPFLAEGSGVVTTRAHVRTVVTEWGVAELFGKSIRERARALIAIAHPDFREELTAQARKTHYL